MHCRNDKNQRIPQRQICLFRSFSLGFNTLKRTPVLCSKVKDTIFFRGILCQCIELTVSFLSLMQKSEVSFKLTILLSTVQAEQKWPILNKVFYSIYTVNNLCNCINAFLFYNCIQRFSCMEMSSP